MPPASLFNASGVVRVHATSAMDVIMDIEIGNLRFLLMWMNKLTLKESFIVAEAGCRSPCFSEGSENQMRYFQNVSVFMRIWLLPG